MTALFTSIVDAIAVLVIVEAVALSIVSARSMRGPAVPDILFNLAAGLFLLLALRAALSEASWPWVAAMLAAAGLAHVVDQARRWRA